MKTTHFAHNQYIYHIGTLRIKYSVYFNFMKILESWNNMGFSLKVQLIELWVALCGVTILLYITIELADASLKISQVNVKNIINSIQSTNTYQIVPFHIALIIVRQNRIEIKCEKIKPLTMPLPS